MVAVLPEPFCRQLVQLRKQYDQWSINSLPPHITMIRPLRALPETLRRRNASLEYPFRIVFQDWQAFRNPDANVVWLDPGQEEPRRVAEKLHTDYPELNELDNRRYMPGKDHIYHITVANHIPDTMFKSVWEKLRHEPISGECMIKQLSVYVRDLPDGHWKIIL